jgi:hypothetical protein
MPSALVEDAEATAAAEDSDNSAVENFFLSLIPGSSGHKWGHSGNSTLICSS